MKYRITIESEKHDDDGRITWEDVYQQVIEDLRVNKLVSDINMVPQLANSDEVLKRIKEYPRI